MSNPVRIAFYSDVHCPYAYLSAYRLQQLREEYRGKIIIEYKSLALEYINKRPTPKFILDNETPLILLQEPAIPYQPWNASLTEWPVTMLPAFEAIKCAERQGAEQAADLDWAIRVAFFHGSKCISMRSVLFELAEQVGLDMQRFEDDYDGGVAKRLVIQEAREGWEQLHVPNSPTIVLPGGEQLSYFALPRVGLDPRHNFRVSSFEPARLDGKSPLDLYRALLESVLQ
ncbi:MAG TPA: DsbA family protein [Dictyobacter sp.]|jgi:predicted DsbA family dithiol-disulfide isomerase|nr:DsbA family protein [Dictyobacter sp.]